MRVTIHISDEIGAEAESFAKQEGKSVSSFYAEAVEEAIARRKRRQAHERITELVGAVDLDEYPRAQFERAQRELRRDDGNR